MHTCLSIQFIKCGDTDLKRIHLSTVRICNQEEKLEKSARSTCQFKSPPFFSVFFSSKKEFTWNLQLQSAYISFFFFFYNFASIMWKKSHNFRHCASVVQCIYERRATRRARLAHLFSVLKVSSCCWCRVTTRHKKRKDLNVHIDECCKKKKLSRKQNEGSARYIHIISFNIAIFVSFFSNQEEKKN